MTTQTVPIITKKMLRGACKEQKKIFKAEWPDGAEATLGNVLRAVELGLNLEWGRRLFSPTARAEYERQVGALWAEYKRQEAALRAEYNRQEAALWAEYQRQIAPFWLAAFLASHGGVE